MERVVHTFDNGVRVYDDHLLERQRERYKKAQRPRSRGRGPSSTSRSPAAGWMLADGSARGRLVITSILARKLSWSLTIHAVEPLAGACAALSCVKIWRWNGLTDADAVIHPEGLGSSEGDVRFLDRGYAAAAFRARRAAN